MNTPDVAIIIVNWNGRDLLERCLHSIEATCDDIRYRIWIVDNGSTDGSIELIHTDFPTVQLIVSKKNSGFGGGNNIALRALGIHADHSSEIQAPTPPYVWLLNPDTIVQPGNLQSLLRIMASYPKVGAVGGILLNEDGSFQSSYIEFPSLKREFLLFTGLGGKLYGPTFPSASPKNSRQFRMIDYVVGASIVVRSRVLQAVGLFDEGFFMYSDEVDLCYRIQKAGWKIAFAPSVATIHLGGGSTRKVRAQMLAEIYRSRIRFFKKHHGAFAANSIRGMLLLMFIAKWIRDKFQRSHDPQYVRLNWILLRRALGW